MVSAVGKAGLFVVAVSLLPLGACRRPPPRQPALEETAAPIVPPKPPPEESEEEDKPPPPPPPPKPTSPPPTGDAGFTFGQARKDAYKACTKKATWKRYEEYWSCTKPLEDPGFEGTPVLGFCDDVLCAIGYSLVPEETLFETWNAAYTKIREVLVARHGAPTTQSEQLPDDCKNEGFVECLTSGKARAEASWIWDEGHKVTLSMGPKKSGEGPVAIRVVSVPTKAP